MTGGEFPTAELLPAALRSAYAVPDPQTSEEQRDRFHGLDIASRTGEDLYRELTVLRVVNYFIDSAWHAEREVAISAELGRRGGRRK